MTPAFTSKTIVCPICYLATDIMLVNEPRTPAPGNLWACKECNELSVFDDEPRPAHCLRRREGQGCACEALEQKKAGRGTPDLFPVQFA